MGIFNFSGINQKILGSPASPLEFKSCLIIFQHVYMYVPMHTHTVVCKYVCMCHCFKIKRYEFFYNVFVREAEARPGTVPPKSELWEELTLLSPSQTFGEDSLSLSPLIYATDCVSCITSCQLAGCIILDFPCQRRFLNV